MNTNSMSQEDLIVEIENVNREFIQTLSQFTEDKLNKVPFEGSWTAGQVAEHITKSNGGILEQLLNGKTKSANRPYDEKVAVVQDVFRSKEKMKSAPQLEPSKPPHNLDSLLNSLKKQKEQQIETIKEKDLKALISELEFPPSPDGLTGYEWLQLMIEHANRHRKQIGNIYKKL